jgi:hypothetical protein
MMMGEGVCRLYWLLGGKEYSKILEVKAICCLHRMPSTSKIKKKVVEFPEIPIKVWECSASMMQILVSLR